MRTATHADGSHHATLYCHDCREWVPATADTTTPNLALEDEWTCDYCLSPILCDYCGEEFSEAHEATH